MQQRLPCSPCLPGKVTAGLPLLRQTRQPRCHVWYGWKRPRLFFTGPGTSLPPKLLQYRCSETPHWCDQGHLQCGTVHAPIRYLLRTPQRPRCAFTSGVDKIHGRYTEQWLAPGKQTKQAAKVKSLSRALGLHRRIPRLNSFRGSPPVASGTFNLSGLALSLGRPLRTRTVSVPARALCPGTGPCTWNPSPLRRCLHPTHTHTAPTHPHLTRSLPVTLQLLKSFAPALLCTPSPLPILLPHPPSPPSTTNTARPVRAPVTSSPLPALRRRGRSYSSLHLRVLR